MQEKRNSFWDVVGPDRRNRFFSIGSHPSSNMKRLCFVAFVSLFPLFGVLIAFAFWLPAVILFGGFILVIYLLARVNQRRPQDYRAWHPWFAWHPVRTKNGHRWAWLEWIERSGWGGLDVESYWYWEYRRFGEKTPSFNEEAAGL